MALFANSVGSGSIQGSHASDYDLLNDDLLTKQNFEDDENVEIANDEEDDIDGPLFTLPLILLLSIRVCDAVEYGLIIPSLYNYLETIPVWF